MQKDKVIKAFRDEFGIHFKDCKGELQFAELFIEEALRTQREELVEKVRGMYGVTHSPVGGISNIVWLKKDDIINLIQSHEN